MNPVKTFVRTENQLAAQGNVFSQPDLHEKVNACIWPGTNIRVAENLNLKDSVNPNKSTQRSEHENYWKRSTLSQPYLSISFQKRISLLVFSMSIFFLYNEVFFFQVVTQAYSEEKSTGVEPIDDHLMTTEVWMPDQFYLAMGLLEGAWPIVT